VVCPCFSVSSSLLLLRLFGEENGKKKGVEGGKKGESRHEPRNCSTVLRRAFVKREKEQERGKKEEREGRKKKKKGGKEQEQDVDMQVVYDLYA